MTRGMTPAGTRVSAEICHTCCHGIAQWNHDTGRAEFWCDLNLMDDEQCLSYSREPGSEGDD